MCCAALSVVGAGISFYFAIVFRFAVGIQGNPTFTSGPDTASLTLMVTLVGLLVAVAAIAIGIAAVFGYGEIRQITTRRTDELLTRVIGRLRKRSEIIMSEAKGLLQMLQEESLEEFEPEPALVRSSSLNQTQETETPDATEEYP